MGRHQSLLRKAAGLIWGSLRPAPGGKGRFRAGTSSATGTPFRVLVSATSYFPAQARPIMRRYPESLSDQ